LYYKIINKRKLFAAKVGDRIGKIAFFPGLFHKKGRRIPFDSIQRILIIRTSYIGDVVLTLPILSPLKKLFPHAKISFLTTSNAAEILEKNPYVDEIISYDAFWFYRNKAASAFLNYLKILRFIRLRPYDLVIEARGDIRDIFLLAYLSKNTYRISYDVGGGGFLLTHVVPFRKIEHKIRYHMGIVKYLGSTPDSVEWDMYLTEDEKHLADRMLKEKGVLRGRTMIAIHPGGRKKLKRWYPEGFAGVAHRLTELFDASILIMGGPDDVEIARLVERSARFRSFMLVGETSLRLMAAVLEKCDLFICNDSCALHVASMMGTPTVAIFGPSKSMETGPWGSTCRIVEKNFECRYACDEDVCNRSDYNACMRAIRQDDVLDAACDILYKKNGPAAYAKKCNCR